MRDGYSFFCGAHLLSLIAGRTVKYKHAIIMRMVSALAGAFFAGPLALTGCAEFQPVLFEVKVDAISRSKMDRKTYVLLPGNKDTNADDLQFEEYAIYLNRALNMEGFVAAHSVEKADIIVFAAYGIGAPQEHQYSYSLPVWGKTGISSSNTNGSMDAFGNFHATTTHTPTYGITGSSTYTDSYATYFRFMVLEAFDLGEYRKSKKEIQLWKITATSSGTSSDLRLVFPMLVAASKPYIGRNSGAQIEVILREDDERIGEITGITKLAL